MEVLAVKHEGGRFLIAIETATGLSLCTMPDDTLEWRSAEYLIDPSETDLLMDFVLYEPHMPQEEELSVLYTAATVGEAREIHTSRILAYKNKIRPAANAWKNRDQRIKRLQDAGAQDDWISRVLDGDALLPIREGHAMDLNVLYEKALLVEDIRRRAAEKRTKQAQRDPGTRDAAKVAEALRARRLGGRKVGSPADSSGKG